MKKMYVLIIICMVILSYFGTKLVANINDYSVQKSMETKRKNNVPVIETVADDITISQNTSINYNELINSAIDEEDGNILANVTHNDIDTSKVGIQNLIYTVTDSDGNTTAKTVHITIEKVVNNESQQGDEPMEQS